SALPAQARSGFVEGFSNAGSHGLEVGAGQTGSGFKPPAGTPTDVVELIARVARNVFDYAFVSAMRWSMIVPAAVLFAAALSCLAIRGRRTTQPEPAAAAVA